MSVEGNEVVIGFRAETVRVTGELRELEYIFYRVTSLLNRMGMPPEAKAILQSTQKLVLAIRLLHSAVLQLHAEAPYLKMIGWLSVAGLALITTDTVADMQKARDAATTEEFKTH